jgi:hypothetical protein
MLHVAGRNDASLRGYLAKRTRASSPALAREKPLHGNPRLLNGEKRHSATLEPDEVLAGTRESVMGKLKAGTAFKDTQTYLHGLLVSVVPIENSLELYVFEAYAAMALETSE